MKSKIDLSLSEQDMVDILEDIARNGGSTARIQAIKLLREIDDGERTPAEGFEELDRGDEVAARRNYRTKAA